MRKAGSLPRDLDVVIVGAGFAGLAMLKRLRDMGLQAHVCEDGGDIGGTWYWNRYPGARCDTESLQYSYQFDDDLQQEWEWSEKYATQPEILRYINHVADRFDLRRDISTGTRVESAVFDEQAGRWTLTTAAGACLTATFCVMATGCLSAPIWPQIEGLDGFAGETYRTARWPHERVEFAGKRIGIIGTGSSAIQALPLIAAEADRVYVFQRTPNYAVPAHNGPLDPDYARAFKARYGENRAKARELVSGFLCPYNPKSALAAGAEELKREYDARWARGGLAFLGAFSDITYDGDANQTATAYIHDRIREIVDDPDVAELLIPNSVVGCKRLCVDTDYYRTYNRDNVTLVDLRSAPIERIGDAGVVAGGRTYEIDMLVLATGFDAMTGALKRIDIRGRGGLALGDKWRDGPRSYLGLAMAGFPNLFTITGPGSPSVLTNMLPSIEQHVDFIADCLAHMRANGHAAIESTREAEDGWVAYNEDCARATLRYDCSSWYLGANVPGKPRVFMPFVGGLPVYINKCREIVEAGYRGFDLSPAVRAHAHAVPAE
jgi:cyclohexanone monooxygenase